MFLSNAKEHCQIASMVAFLGCWATLRPTTEANCSLVQVSRIQWVWPNLL